MEIYFEVPDSSPTPAPFVPSSDTEVDSADDDDGLDGTSSTTVPRAISGDDDSAYFSGDDAGSDEPDNGGVSASSSPEPDDGGVSASSSPDSDDDRVGTSSSSALGAESTGSGATNGPLPWTFTLAVGAMSSMLSRATGLLRG